VISKGRELLMYLDLLKIFATPIIGLIGVFVGSKLKLKSDIKVQKEFLLRELNINKNQEASQGLLEIVLEMESLNLVFSNWEKYDYTAMELHIILGEKEAKIKNLENISDIKILYLNEEIQHKIKKQINKFDKSIRELYACEEILRSAEKNAEIKQLDAVLGDIGRDTDYAFSIISEINQNILKEMAELRTIKVGFWQGILNWIKRK